MKNYQWLDHLIGIIPTSAQGDKLSMFSIALEGWRRGLTLKFINVKFLNSIEVSYSLSDGVKEHKFAVSKGDKVTQEGMRIGKSKELTKKYLKEAGVPVPDGKSFDAGTTIEDILKFAESISYPVVLKPTNGNLGKGVIANIKSENELKEAIHYVREELKYEKVICERFISGEEYRIYVIDDKVIGATNRIPANVIGDGKSSIRILIQQKNNERKKNPNLSNRPIKIDKELTKRLKENKLTLEYIPKKDERIFLSDKSNLSSGGDPIDATDILTPEMKVAAINAAKAAKMVQCGVDMIIDSKNNHYAVLELNSRPGIGAHLFPMEGNARDIPKAIIDYYFPESKSSTDKSLLYFDFDKIFNLLRSGAADEVTVPTSPKETVVSKQFIFYGKVQGVGYRKWLQRRAVNLRIHGFAENKKRGELSVVVAGTKKQLEEFVAIIHADKPSKAIVDGIDELSWDCPVKVGFEILTEKVNQQNLESKYKEEQSKLKKIKKDYEKVKKQLKAIEKSKIWIYTSPLRKIVRKIKRV